MSKLPLDLSPASVTTKPGLNARALWRLAYRQSRAQVRDGGRHGLGARYVHCLGHLRRRFGPSGWPVCQKAAALALDLRAVSKAATGTREELAREGMLTRCVRLEAAPRGGWSFAWTFDELGSPNSVRSLRRGRAIRLQQDRARCAEVARAMAADRHRIGRGPFFTITDLGRAALADATAHA